MKLSIGWTAAGACLSLLAVLFLGSQLIQPSRPLLNAVAFDTPVISPNADGTSDVTTFRYTLSRNADISLIFADASGQTYSFREGEARVPGAYSVLFSGVVNGYSRPDETNVNTIERRLMPDGVYTWTLNATDTTGIVETATGILTLTDADTPLPLISTFTVGPTLFSPNQDGIADRVSIDVYLDQPAELRVFLRDADGTEIPVSARKEGREPGDAGRQMFDYEGGVDLGADPPADGVYDVFAVAQDAVGQRVSAVAQLTIAQGGKPLAEIAPQAVGVDVVFTTAPYLESYASTLMVVGEKVPLPADAADLALTAISMPVGDLLVFKLTVENYNAVPIRTTYPPPGTVYEQDQMAASLGAYESPGAWRVGIQCETSTVPFPYRWALGDATSLEAIPDPRDGTIYHYVPAQSSVVVWGAIRMTQIEQRQNPQTCWAGLIQEDVEVSLRNSYVGPREIELVDPSA